MHQGLHSIREFAWRRISLLDHRHPTSGNTAILLLRTTTTINNNNNFAILFLRRHLDPVFQTPLYRTPLMLECRFFGGNATVPLLGRESYFFRRYPVFWGKKFSESTAENKFIFT